MRINSGHRGKPATDLGRRSGINRHRNQTWSWIAIGLQRRYRLERFRRIDPRNPESPVANTALAASKWVRRRRRLWLAGHGVVPRGRRRRLTRVDVSFFDIGLIACGEAITSLYINVVIFWIGRMFLIQVPSINFRREFRQTRPAQNIAEMIRGTPDERRYK